MNKPGRIWLKIKKKDFGKSIKCDIKKLPAELLEHNHKCVTIKIPEKAYNDSLYLGIVVRNNGWFDCGLGEFIKNYLKDYNSVLNLIALGHCESIDKNGIISLKNWKNEPINIKKEQGIDVYEGNVFVRILKNEYDYEYVFDKDWEIFD